MKKSVVKKSGNPVAKYMFLVNKAVVEVDKKKAYKKGYKKHSQQRNQDDVKAVA